MLRTMNYYINIFGFSGFICYWKSKFSNSISLLEINREGIKHPFHLRMPSSDVPTFHQIFIDEEYDFDVENEPEVIVDAGANIGLTSIYFANKYPNAKIIAIEPEASNFEMLVKNTKKYEAIIPVQAALWNQNGKINLVDPGLGNWGFMTLDAADSTEEDFDVCHAVDAITVDKILDMYELSKINILKIDIEGSEKEVMADSAPWIEKVDALIVELHERFKPGCSRVFYNATNGFNSEWTVGENVYLSRDNMLKKNK